MTRPVSGERRRPESVRIVQAGRKFRMAHRGTPAFPLATGQRRGQGRADDDTKAHFDWLRPPAGLNGPNSTKSTLDHPPQLAVCPPNRKYSTPLIVAIERCKAVSDLFHLIRPVPARPCLSTHTCSRSCQCPPVPAAVLNRNTSESQNYFISAPSSLLQGPHPLFRSPRAPDLETIRLRSWTHPTLFASRDILGHSDRDGAPFIRTDMHTHTHTRFLVPKEPKKERQRETQCNTSAALWTLDLSRWAFCGVHPPFCSIHVWHFAKGTDGFGFPVYSSLMNHGPQRSSAACSHDSTRVRLVNLKGLLLLLLER